jgi:hypothetical protein
MRTPIIALTLLAAVEVDKEVGSMYRIRFDDGSEIDAFRDELSSPTDTEA